MLAPQVNGSCLREGTKPALIGGTDKLPKDFERPPNYVDEERVRVWLCCACTQEVESVLCMEPW